MARYLTTCVYLIALVLVASCQRKARDDDKNVQRCNQYIDKLLHKLTQEENFDPHLMEDSSVGFNKKIIFVNVSGEAKFSNGRILGLKTLHRPENCAMEEIDDTLHVKSNLAAGVIELHYDGSVKFMSYGPTISVKGEIHYIEVYMEFRVNAKTGQEGSLDKFHIDDMRGMKVSVSGLGPVTWAMNPIISGVTKIFKAAVRNFFERKVRDHLEEYLPGYQFPVEGVDIDETPVPDVAVTSDERETSEPVVTTEEKVVTEESFEQTVATSEETLISEEETSEPGSNEKSSDEEISEPVEGV